MFHLRLNETFVDDNRKMNASSCSMTSCHSTDLSYIDNNNETLNSYSLLFDKNENNFSTSSDISLFEYQSSSIDQNRTVKLTTNNNRISEESLNFNPWLLLFTQNDQQRTVRIEKVKLDLH